jgi:hypothetical protein
LTANSPSSRSGPVRRVPRARRLRAAGLMRVVLWLLAASVFAQPVFAGLFLDGHDGWRDWHATNGMLVLPLLALAQVVLAVLAWRPGRAPGWLPLASLGLLLAIIGQNLLGMSGQLALHVPLAVAIFGLVGTLLLRTRDLGRPSIDPRSRARCGRDTPFRPQP